ncbi:MAG: hypothetical protein PHD37_05610 [Gallionellaceae bacterium]|nr:hypothetical protein [Gallionellaceae bacterium]
MLKQRGWAALLPIGLIAIAATGGTVMVVEKASNANEPTLAGTMFKSEPQLRQGVVTYEMEEAKASRAAVPGAQK